MSIMPRPGFASCNETVQKVMRVLSALPPANLTFIKMEYPNPKFETIGKKTVIPGRIPSTYHYVTAGDYDSFASKQEQGAYTHSVSDGRTC